MQETIEIRQARDSDATMISALISELAVYFTPPHQDTIAAWFASSITPSAITENIRHEKFSYLVACSGKTLAGVIAMRDTTHVHHLFVAPAWQRRGIATRLWQRAKAAALATGKVKGFSVRSSEYAVPVYESFGFRVAGERSEKKGIAFVPMTLHVETVQV